MAVITLKSYTTLLRQVREVLVVGQQRIEQEKIRTYWETGRLIQTHILQSKERAEYGAEVMKRLASDLNIHHRLLERCRQFATMYPKAPIASARTQLSWSHYRELLAIDDDKKRTLLEAKVQKGAWSSRELAVRIKEEQPSDETVAKHPLKVLLATKPLIPARGILYTYRVVKRQALGPDDSSSELLIDLGFGIFRNVEQKLVKHFAEDQVVESWPKDDAYKFSAGPRTPKDLFTYQAFIEKVVDADTLKVRLDLGFDTWTRQYLRFRGINAPEVGTPAGDEAKAFIQSYLKDVPMVIIRSSRSDKYDRYLADIFIPAAAHDEIFLNNLLLEHGHASRVLE